jgi:hypothetical protein
MEEICELSCTPTGREVATFCSVNLSAEATMEINLYEIRASFQRYLLGTDGMNGNFKNRVRFWFQKWVENSFHHGLFVLKQE